MNSMLHISQIYEVPFYCFLVYILSSVVTLDNVLCCTTVTPSCLNCTALHCRQEDGESDEDDDATTSLHIGRRPHVRQPQGRRTRHRERVRLTSPAVDNILVSYAQSVSGNHVEEGKQVFSSQCLRHTLKYDCNT